jgi:hypothetical protein
LKQGFEAFRPRASSSQFTVERYAPTAATSSNPGHHDPTNGYCLLAKCDSYSMATAGRLIAAMPHERLKQSIADLLAKSLGLVPLPHSIFSVWLAGLPARVRTNPYLEGLWTGACYILLFCGIPWVLFFVAPSHIAKPSWSLFFLQVYGGFWCGWAVTSSIITSSSVSKIIENNIIPELSAETAKKIDQEIARDFGTTRLLCVSWGIAIPGAALAGYLVYHDASTISKPAIGEVVWWCCGWALLFAAAAKVVNVARFYRLFAAHLADDPGGLYAMDPARSTLVTSIAAVAQRVMLFWFAGAVSIALVIPFDVKDWSSWWASTYYSPAPGLFHSLPAALLTLDLPHNSFVGIDVLITGFFSIGFGTIVFLRNEAALRQAVNTVTRSTLRLVEIEVADLSHRLGELDEANWKRLAELNALHKEVATAGSYRSIIVSGLSVMVPFVIPLISLFFKN